MKLKLHITYLTVLLLMACTTNTVKVKNEKQGRLKASIKLEVSEVKKFGLDDNSAPKPEYTQMYEVSDGKRYFTFLNNYNNSIYFYDYSTSEYVEKISWEKIGPNGIPGLKGYHIKSLDSIYVFNKHPYEIILTNNKNSILNRISLWGNMKDNSKWGYYYPQYYLQTVTPFIETDHEILLTGFYFGSIPESILSEFKFTARLDFKTNQLKFSNTYPSSLYGFNYNWCSEMFTVVYSDLHPDGDKLVLSFPVSHDLYLTDLNTGGYKKVYAGSNFAGTIYSMEKKPRNISNEEILRHFLKIDEYAAIRYDKFRKVYYRFLLKAVPEATVHMRLREKIVAVIIMDENFKYLGEVTIGKWENWNWQNSFVTREGLNIEYFGDDSEENNLTLKIFTIIKI